MSKNNGFTNEINEADDDSLPPLLSPPPVPVCVCLFKNVPVCTGTTRTCVPTSARVAGIHGTLFECTHVFSVCRTAHTQTTATTTHTTQHNITRRQKETERERREDGRGETRQDRTRQQKTRQDEREEYKIGEEEWEEWKEKMKVKREDQEIKEMKRGDSNSIFRAAGKIQRIFERCWQKAEQQVFFFFWKNKNTRWFHRISWNLAFTTILNWVLADKVIPSRYRDIQRTCGHKFTCAQSAPLRQLRGASHVLSGHPINAARSARNCHSRVSVRLYVYARLLCICVGMRVLVFSMQRKHIKSTLGNWNARRQLYLLCKRFL